MKTDINSKIQKHTDTQYWITEYNIIYENECNTRYNSEAYSNTIRCVIGDFNSDKSVTEYYCIYTYDKLFEQQLSFTR